VSTQSSGKIVVIHPDGSLDFNPGLLALFSFLLDDGFKVDYWIDPTVPSIQTVIDGLSVRYLHKVHRKLLSVRRKLKIPRSIFRLATPFFADEKVSLVIGVDRVGMIYASSLAEILGVKKAHFSYEIYFADENCEEFKEEEILACKDIEFSVCQDTERGTLLSRENKIDIGKIINIPVAPNKEISKPPTASFDGATEGHRLIRQQLGVTQQYVAVFGGSFAQWAMIEEIIASCSDWPQTWALIINVHPQAKIPAYLNKSFSNVYFRKDHDFSMDSYRQLLSEADLGLAFYRPTFDSCSSGKNISNIGLSSGKISCYLMQSLPVICNEIGEIGELINHYQAGRALAAPSEIPAALERFNEASISVMKENASRLFQERLDPELFKSSFLQSIRRSIAE
jgi:hypothetical protein